MPVLSIRLEEGVWRTRSLDVAERQKGRSLTLSDRQGSFEGTAEQSCLLSACPDDTSLQRSLWICQSVNGALDGWVVVL